MTTDKDVVDSNRLITVRDVRDVICYSYGNVQRVLTEQLHMMMVSARWISRLLANDHKQKCVNL